MIEYSYDYDISMILRAEAEYVREHGKAPIALSRWDPSDTLSFPNELITAACKNTRKAFLYYYPHELLEIKELIAHYVNNAGDYLDELDSDNVAVSSSTTAALFLVLLALKRHGRRKGLSCRPIYWSIRQNCRDLGLELELIESYSVNNYLVPLHEFRQAILSKKPEFVILTNPVYSVGLQLNHRYVFSIQEVCKEIGTLLIVDEAFHMPWIATPQEPAYSKEMIVIRSPLKNLFANGLKVAHIVGPAEIIEDAEYLFESIQGGLTFAQVRLAEIIYDPEHYRQIHHKIRTALQRNIQKISHHYMQIKDLCSLSKVATIQRASSGPNTILELYVMPASESVMQQFLSAAIRNLGISVIPSWRFSINKEGNPFGIRINLAQAGESFVEHVDSILKLSITFS